MLSKTVQIGKIPSFKNTESIRTYNIEDEQKAMISFCLSVQEDYKRREENFYAEELFNYKAFGKSAQFIANNFKVGDLVYVVSRPVAAKKKPDSDEYYPPYFAVEKISWLPSGNSEQKKTELKKSSSSTSDTASSNPFASQQESAPNPFSAL